MTDKQDRIWSPWRYTYIKEAVGPKTDCFLCEALEAHQDRERLLLYRGEQAFVIMNRFPYNNGHLLIAPNRHIGNLEDLEPDEMSELFELVRTAKGWLDKTYHPDGHNIGINIGRVAGAGLPGHLHVHIVPRWNGDVNFMPVLGFTKVISEGLQSSWDQIRKVIDEEAKK